MQGRCTLVGPGPGPGTGRPAHPAAPPSLLRNAIARGSRKASAGEAELRRRGSEGRREEPWDTAGGTLLWVGGGPGAAGEAGKGSACAKGARCCAEECSAFHNSGRCAGRPVRSAHQGATTWPGSDDVVQNEAGDLQAGGPGGGWVGGRQPHQCPDVPHAHAYPPPGPSPPPAPQSRPGA